MNKQVDYGGEVYPHGITRRDWLAGLAMQGIRANDVSIRVVSKVANLQGIDPEDIISRLSYSQADSMIAEGRQER